MTVDILKMRDFEPNAHAIDVALPVLAIECEATPPLENYLDAYEEAVLKLVSLGLSTKGISKTLYAAESLVEIILSKLDKKYVVKEKGKPWRLTEAGEKYIDGSVQDRASSESQYGYMFINAIKKEVLPYFYQGDVGRISLFRGSPLPLKLTLGGNESETFAPIAVKQSKLHQAFRAYFRNKKTAAEYEEGEITKEEAEDLFRDLEDFDEEPDSTEDNQKADARGLRENMFIRALDKKPVALYLGMRIIIDPSCPGGYRAESPFDLGGVDDNGFLRQMQWLEQSDSAYLSDEVLKDFLQREIRKLSPSYKTSEKDYQVFVLERIPLLKLYRSRFPYIYENMERIYSLIQRQHSLLEKENIVNSLARSVVEGLFNAYFKAIGKDKLGQIQQKAFDDAKTYKVEDCKKRICGNAHLDENTLRWVSSNYYNTILKRLSFSYGNSIMEKFICMLIVEYYLGDKRIHKFLFQPSIEQKYRLIDRLNRIRRKVSHDTDERFSFEDYEFYMANVFDLINNLLDAFRED